MCWHQSYVGIDRDLEMAIFVSLGVVIAARTVWRAYGSPSTRGAAAIMIACCAVVVAGSVTMGFGYSPLGWWLVVKAAGLSSAMFVVEIVRAMRAKSDALPAAIVVDAKTKP